MPKAIQYPTPQWIATWLAKHPGTDAADADCAWWDDQIDKGNPTPYDLTQEQEKAVKEIRGNARAVNAYGKEVKRERKPNDNKRWIMSRVKTLFEGFQLNGKCEAVDLTNPERTLDFSIGGKHYTLTLTEHREKKG